MPLALASRKIGRSWTVLALMVLQVKWLCSCYSSRNLGEFILTDSGGWRGSR